MPSSASSAVRPPVSRSSDTEVAVRYRAADRALVWATAMEPYWVSSIRPKATSWPEGSTIAKAMRNPRAEAAAVARSMRAWAVSSPIGAP